MRSRHRRSIRSAFLRRSGQSRNVGCRNYYAPKLQAPEIVTREKKIESQCHRFVVLCPTMQSIKICDALGRQVNNLGVDNQRRTEPSRFIHDARIAFGPVIAVHRVESHPTIPHMDLEPIAIMLQLNPLSPIACSKAWGKFAASIGMPEVRTPAS